MSLIHDNKVANNPHHIAWYDAGPVYFAASFDISDEASPPEKPGTLHLAFVRGKDGLNVTLMKLLSAGGGSMNMCFRDVREVAEGKLIRGGFTSSMKPGDPVWREPEEMLIKRYGFTAERYRELVGQAVSVLEPDSKSPSEMP